MSALDYKNYVESCGEEPGVYTKEDFFYPCGYEGDDWDEEVERLYQAGTKAWEAQFSASPDGIYMKFLAGELDLLKCTGQQMRDIWSLCNGKPTGRKTSGALTSKKALIVACITAARVQAKYPAY